MSIAGIFVTIAELDVLDGMRPLWKALYIALRTRMDFKTGRVGVKPEVSWMALCQDLHIDPHTGFEERSPSKDQLRRAAAGLVRAELVVMQSSEAQRKLIFFLPMARRSSFVQNKPATNPPDQPDRPLQRGNGGQADIGEFLEPATHRGSVLRSNHHNITGDREAVDNLQWSPALRADERQVITKVITAARLNGSAQLLLDELTAAIEKGAIRKGAAQFFAGMVARWKSKTFAPTTDGIKVAARRAQAPPPGRGNATTKPPAIAPPESARAHIAAMRRNLKRGKR